MKLNGRQKKEILDILIGKYIQISNVYNHNLYSEKQVIELNEFFLFLSNELGFKTNLYHNFLEQKRQVDYIYFNKSMLLGVGSATISPFSTSINDYLLIPDLCNLLDEQKVAYPSFLKDLDKINVVQFKEEDVLVSFYGEFKFISFDCFKKKMENNCSIDELYTSYCNKWKDSIKNSIENISNLDVSDAFLPAKNYDSFMLKTVEVLNLAAKDIQAYYVAVGLLKARIDTYIEQYLKFDKWPESDRLKIKSTSFIINSKSFDEYLNVLQELMILRREF